MPTITDIALCIRHWDFSETSQTVSLFTREQGVIRGLAKGSRRAKGMFSGGIDVLTRGQVVAIVKPGRELATLTAWHLQELHRHVRENLAANRAGLYMADLIHHMVIDHDPHPALFDAADAGLSALIDRERVQFELLRFQWALLCETGYRPELDLDVRTGRPIDEGREALGFDALAGGVVAESAAVEAARPPTGQPWRVRRETIELLRQVAAEVDSPGRVAPGGDAGQLSTPPLSGGTPRHSAAAIDRANRLLAAYLRELIGDETAGMRWAFRIERPAAEPLPRNENQPFRPQNPPDASARSTADR